MDLYLYFVMPADVNSKPLFTYTEFVVWQTEIPVYKLYVFHLSRHGCVYL